jgi:hypothetical protein
MTRLTATDIAPAITDRELREQHPELHRLIERLEQPTPPPSEVRRENRIPRIPQPHADRRRPKVICTRPSLWQRLLDWLAGDRP